METKKHNPIVYRIYDEMKNHIGKENAISGAKLSGMFGISDRTLREHIRKIRECGELSKVILTCNKGYYIPTQEDGMRDNNRLYNQAFSLLRSAREQDKKAGREGQFKIKMGEFYQDYVQAFGQE